MLCDGLLRKVRTNELHVLRISKVSTPFEGAEGQKITVHAEVIERRKMLGIRDHDRERCKVRTGPPKGRLR